MAETKEVISLEQVADISSRLIAIIKQLNSFHVDSEMKNGIASIMTGAKRISNSAFEQNIVKYGDYEPATKE